MFKLKTPISYHLFIHSLKFTCTSIRVATVYVCMDKCMMHAIIWTVTVVHLVSVLMNDSVMAFDLCGCTCSWALLYSFRVPYKVVLAILAGLVSLLPLILCRLLSECVVGFGRVG